MDKRIIVTRKVMEKEMIEFKGKRGRTGNKKGKERRKNVLIDAIIC